METLQAIQTEYRGYKFRSRLEARWAVFFDALGVDWEYESQGYQLSNGECYLPDFWLPNFSLRNEATTELVAARTKEASDRYHISYRVPYWDNFTQRGIFAEVKSTESGDSAFSKAVQLCADTEKAVWLCDGVPGCREYRFIYPDSLGDPNRDRDGELSFLKNLYDDISGFGALACVGNAKEQAVMIRTETGIATDTHMRHMWITDGDDWSLVNTHVLDIQKRLYGDKYLKAVKAARSARFEFDDKFLAL